MNYTSKRPDKVALVTGASRRIGAAIASLLHDKGFLVAIHCHQSLLEARVLADRLNHQRQDSAAVFQADLSAPGACGKLLTSVMEWSKRLDVLVNNASLFLKSECGQFKSKDWQDMFALNVQTPFELSNAAFSLLARHNGSIVNITDIHAEKPLKGYSVYCQTKAALLMQTRSLAREFAPLVRVNAVAPGAIAWPENDNVLDEKKRQQIIARTPMKCHGETGQIAAAVMALLDNTFITGQVLNVDGGRSIA